MTTITVRNRVFKPDLSNSDRQTVWNLPFRVFATLRIWQQRYKDRRYLLTLDERLLKDIGRSYADVQQEAYKPFWQA